MVNKSKRRLRIGAWLMAALMIMSIASFAEATPLAGVPISIYESPSPQAAVLTIAPDASLLTLGSSENGWTQVSFQGVTGFVAALALSVPAPIPEPAPIAEPAPAPESAPAPVFEPEPVAAPELIEEPEVIEEPEEI